MKGIKGQMPPANWQEEGKKEKAQPKTNSRNEKVTFFFGTNYAIILALSFSVVSFSLIDYC